MCRLSLCQDGLTLRCIVENDGVINVGSSIGIQWEKVEKVKLLKPSLIVGTCTGFQIGVCANFDYANLMLQRRIDFRLHHSSPPSN